MVTRLHRTTGCTPAANGQHAALTTSRRGAPTALFRMCMALLRAHGSSAAHDRACQCAPPVFATMRDTHTFMHICVLYGALCRAEISVQSCRRREKREASERYVK